MFLYVMNMLTYLDKMSLRIWLRVRVMSYGDHPLDEETLWDKCVTVGSALVFVAPVSSLGHIPMNASTYYTHSWPWATNGMPFQPEWIVISQTTNQTKLPLFHSNWQIFTLDMKQSNPYAYSLQYSTLRLKLFMVGGWKQMWDTNFFLREKVDFPHIQVINLNNVLYINCIYTI